MRFWPDIGRRGRRRRRGQAEAGFTLVELLVVLVILGLLVGIAVPAAVRYLSSARSDVARVQVENLGVALDLFRVDLGRYPSAEEGLKALVARPPGMTRWNGPYLKGADVPLDPWERAYVYRSAADGGYELLSLGADGAEGGEGENADIVAK